MVYTRFSSDGSVASGCFHRRKKTLKKLQAIYPFANFYFTFTSVNPADPNHTLLFVYGTLKSGYSNHALLVTGHFVGEAATIAEYGFYLGPDEYAPDEPEIPRCRCGVKCGKSIPPRPHNSTNWKDTRIGTSAKR